MPHHVIAKYFTTVKRWEFINGKHDYLRSNDAITLPENTVVILIDKDENVIFGLCRLRGWINSAVSRYITLGPVGTDLGHVKKYFIGIKELRLLKYSLIYEDVRMLSGDICDWQGSGYWDGKQNDFAEVLDDNCPDYVEIRFRIWVLSML